MKGTKVIEEFKKKLLLKPRDIFEKTTKIILPYSPT